MFQGLSHTNKLWEVLLTFRPSLFLHLQLKDKKHHGWITVSRKSHRVQHSNDARVSEVVFYCWCLRTVFSAAFCAVSLGGQRVDAEPAPFFWAAPFSCAPSRAAAPASFAAARLCGCSRVRLRISGFKDKQQVEIFLLEQQWCFRRELNPWHSRR